MEPLEEKLRNALREPQAAKDLSERILTRAQEMRARPLRFLSRPLRAAVAATVLLGAGLLALSYYRNLRDSREQQEAERARQQVIEAFRLAEEQLRPLRKQLLDMQEVGVPVPKETQ